METNPTGTRSQFRRADTTPDEGLVARVLEFRPEPGDGGEPPRQGCFDRLAALPFAWLAGGLMAYGILTFVAIGFLEPTPTNPNLADLWYVQLLDTVFLGAICIGAIGLVKRNPLGFVGIAVAGWLQLVAVVGCPLSGHHSFGAWWIGEFALACAFAVGATYAAYAARVGHAPLAWPSEHSSL